MDFMFVGFSTGIIGGLFGVGGGEIFIPHLIYVFGFSQHQAQGTSFSGLAATHRVASSTSVLQGWIRKF